MVDGDLNKRELHKTLRKLLIAGEEYEVSIKVVSHKGKIHGEKKT